ncbi:putative photosystem I PsaH, reaction centre subunit VI [Helianthus anomalus]
MHRAGAVVAKYGDKSVYFDLEDLGNTTGQWDVYGSDAPSPYNPLQVVHWWLMVEKVVIVVEVRFAGGDRRQLCLTVGKVVIVVGMVVRRC